MAILSKRSLDKLNTCHKDIILICTEAIDIIDFTVIEGHRDRLTQNKAFAENKSKVQWPKSKHNSYPSLAVDLAPYPINWNDKDRFYALAGVMFAIAKSEGINLRWGGTWGDLNTIRSVGFMDLPHYELII